MGLRSNGGSNANDHVSMMSSIMHARNPLPLFDLFFNYHDVHDAVPAGPLA